ncbi:MAG: FAD-binding oxidoreductase [Candidatus Paceibacterota bacterium]
MAEYKQKILMTEFVTHDVKRFIIEKPENYEFEPGQATEVAVAEEGWEDKKRPFTFTSLNEDKVLEFTIKGYPEHNGVTEKLHSLVSGDELLIEDPWGTINYQGEGVFLAGGAGVTPFIAILRNLRNKRKLGSNELIFANKKAKDVILEKEFREMLGDNFIPILTEEEKEGYEKDYINKDYLKRNIDDFSQNFYVCGPPNFVEDLTEALKELGADPDEVVLEE